MTRVKLASDYDMGTGYIAVPTPGRADGLAYSVTYSLGSTLKQRGAPVPPKTTMDRLKARREMYFKHQADIVKYPTNELVIAMRRHKGPFPVYAVYEDGSPEGILNCFNIAGGKKELLIGKTITVNGRASW
jgi:hypothetical protein